MPEVSVVVQLRVTVEPGADPVALEQAIAEQGRRGAKELYRQALAALDAQATEASGGAKQRLEERWVATTFGRVRIWRYRVKGEGGSFHPLDRALGLSRAEASPALRETVCDLATRVPYRQVAEIAARLTGEPISHQGTWRILQAEGARVRTEEGELVASVFELGEAPPPEGLAPELVVVEADGTFLGAQGEEGDRFEVKTGVFYTGKDRAGGRRHRRWRLLDKGCYATTGDQDAFGKGLAARGFAWVGLHRAHHVLCVHDGLDEYGQGFHDWFPHAMHQIDHFHVAQRIWQVSGADAKAFHGAEATGVPRPPGVCPHAPPLASVPGRARGRGRRLPRGDRRGPARRGSSATAAPPTEGPHARGRLRGRGEARGSTWASSRRAGEAATRPLSRAPGASSRASTRRSAATMPPSGAPTGCSLGSELRT